MVSRLGISVGLAAMCVALVGCATSGGTPVGSSAESTVSASAASNNDDYFATMPACHPIDTYADAADLVQGGLATTLVRATISSAPDTDSSLPGDHWYTLDHYTVISGSTVNGQIKRIDESEGDAVLLPPGDYLILLGPEGTPGDYYTANGVEGSFEVTGTTASHRCTTPKGIQPQPGKIASIDDLAAAFSKAIAAQPRRGNAQQTW
jgi:hypothetical protein